MEKFETKMSKKQVVDIGLYVHDNLPYPLQKEIERQNIEIEEGLIAVKTIAGIPATYEFVMIGKTSAGLKNFLYDLAAENGIDLNEVAKNLMK